MRPDPPIPIPKESEPLDLDSLQGDVEIHLHRQLNGPYRWRAWFGWKATTPNFEGVFRSTALRKAKRHLNRLRRVDRTPEESIWS